MSSTKLFKLQFNMTATATSFSLLSTLPDAPPEATRLCNQIEFFSEQINKTTQSVPCPAELLASLSISSTPIPSTTPSNSDKSTQLASSAIESSEQNTLLSSQTSLTVSSSGLASKPAGPVSNSTGPTDKRGLEGGAVAGIAIGMLLAGALIAGVIFFCLLRRQKKQLTLSTSTYPRQHAPYTEWNVGPEKGATVVTVPGRGIDNLLPQPAEDDAITGDLSKIRDNIKNHVRTYYHSERISAGNINENGIRDIAALTGGSAADAAKMLEDPLTRDSALRLIIGSVVLTRCTGERSPSLLPNDVAALSASMPAGSANNGKSAFCRRMTRSDTSTKLNQPCTVNGKLSLEPCCNNGTANRARITDDLRRSQTRSHLWIQSWRHLSKAAPTVVSAARIWT